METPTTRRAFAIADHMESLGAYTQAREVLAMALERDALLQANIALVSRLTLMEAAQHHKHAMAISTDVPEGYDTVLGYLAKYHPEVLDCMDYTNPEATKRDGYWLMHNVGDHRVVNAPPCLRACGIEVVNAWPVEALARRFG